MSGRQGWMRASAAAAAIALCACGGASPRDAQEPAPREPETCRADEDLARCDARLREYSERLSSMMYAMGFPRDLVAGDHVRASSASEAPAPAAPSPEPTTDIEDGLTPQAGPAPQAEPSAEAYGEEEQASSAPPPDCSSARDLRDRICELADAICKLAARNDAAPETTATCESSRTSCKDARERVAQACPE